MLQLLGNGLAQVAFKALLKELQLGLCEGWVTHRLQLVAVVTASAEPARDARGGLQQAVAIGILADGKQQFAHRGLGTASCGPDTLPQYRVGAGTYVLSYEVSLVAGK